jgi:predicted alpha/beta hydrolase family esterase
MVVCEVYVIVAERAPVAVVGHAVGVAVVASSATTNPEPVTVALLLVAVRVHVKDELIAKL